MKPLFRSRDPRQTHSRSNIAFIIEMLVLLVFVAGCLAVLIQMFSFAHHQGQENAKTVKAIHLASNAAECFSADPTAAPEREVFDDMVVFTTVKSESRSAGTLYIATIEVYSADDRDAQAGSRPFYGLETARYVKAGDA